MLLLHGQNGSAHNWDHIAAELKDEFHIIALDQRGHGESDHTRDGYAVDAFASDIQKFTSAISFNTYALVGASLGARNGIYHAGDCSNHLTHLICLDYGPEMSVSSAKNQINGMNDRRLGFRSMQEFVESSMSANARPGLDYYANQARNNLRLNYAGKYVPKHDPEMFWINGSFGAREVPSLWDKWAKISCPILELKGQDSDFLSPEIISKMRHSQPTMQLTEVPDSGHSISSDNPIFLLKQLRDFLVK